MATRLLEIHRVLKPDGSLYLHCDHTVGNYLLELLARIFGDGENGAPGFRGAITWRRANAKGWPSRAYAITTRTLCCYYLQRRKIHL